MSSNISSSETLVKYPSVPVIVNLLMSFLTNAYRRIKHYINPNDNPTDADKYAFKLLDNLNVEEFIEFFQANKVNPNVTIMKGLSLLTKAVEMAHKTSKPKQLAERDAPSKDIAAKMAYNTNNQRQITQGDALSKCIIAINFLIKQGADINHQDNSGRTALLTACHWQHVEIARLLIRHGADMDLATTQQGWKTNPLVAACFKENYQLIELLILNGCSIQKAEQLNQQQNGFKLKLPQLNYIHKVRNIEKLLRIRMLEQKSSVPDSQKFLSKISSIDFNRILEMC